MGQGMALIAPEFDAIEQVCRDSSIESKVIGRLGAKPELIIYPKGHQVILRFE